MQDYMQVFVRPASKSDAEAVHVQRMRAWMEANEISSQEALAKALDVDGGTVSRFMVAEHITPRLLIAFLFRFGRAATNDALGVEIPA